MGEPFRWDAGVGTPGWVVILGGVPFDGSTVSGSSERLGVEAGEVVGYICVRGTDVSGSLLGRHFGFWACVGFICAFVGVDV